MNMNILNLLKSSLGKDALSLAWSLAFVSANIALYYLFTLFITITPIAFLVICLISFIVAGEAPRWKGCFGLIAVAFLALYHWYYGAVLVMVLFGVYLILKRKGEVGFGINGVKQALQVLERNIFKFIVSISRTVFYNVSYMLFPLLFVWLIFVGAALFLHLITLMGNIDRFAEVITVMGVIFGLFQFYLGRHEEKVQKKLVSYFTTLTLPMNEYSYEEFLKFLENKEQHKDVYKSAKELVGTHISELARYFRETGKQKAEIKINLPEFSDTVKFQILEFHFQRSQKLKDAYTEFFAFQRKKISDDLKKKKKELNELMWFLLSNISILEEANASFLGLEALDENKKAESYPDFLMKANIDTLKDIFEIVL